jgi:hypothetical protein
MDVIEEVWKTIPDFPKYAVSDHGHIMNIRTENLVKPQITPQGIVYAPLYEDGEGYTRSIKVLVAKAFVDGEDDIFDTPINKDGNKSNNRADNIVWRPRWFAVKYSRQFLTEYANAEVGPVYEVDTEERWNTIYEVGTAFGLLFRDIFRSSYAETPVFPTGQIFRIPNAIHVR